MKRRILPHAVFSLFTLLLFLASATAERLYAQGGSSPWASADIGGVSAAGSSSETDGVATVRGSGEDIWNNADEFHFRYRQWTGNGVFIVRVTGLTNTNGWAKAGIMVRSDLTPASPHVFACVNPVQYPSRVWRPAAGAASQITSALSSPDRAMPMWLKLTRDGSTISAYFSSDGANWRSLGSDTFAFPATVYVGLAVTSHNDGTICTATFDNISLAGVAPGNLSAIARSPTRVALRWIDNSLNESGFEIERAMGSSLSFVSIGTAPANATSFSDAGASPTTSYNYRARAILPTGPTEYSAVATVVTPPPSPAGWSSEDIGSPSLSGQSTASSGAFRLSGAGVGVGGADLVHTASGRGDFSYRVPGYYDAFQFCYQPWTGDGEIIARVSALSGSPSGEAGIMVRGGLDESAVNVFYHVRASGELALKARAGRVEGYEYRWDFRRETLTHASSAGAPPPQWLKLVRGNGGVMTYSSVDGATWSEVGWVTTVMDANIYLGLAVSSRDEPPPPAIGSLANGTFDNVIVRAVTTPIAPPAAPTGLTATAMDPTTATLSWTNNAHYDNVQIERATNGGAFELLYGFAVSQYTDMSLDGGTTYSYRVRGVRGTMMSAYSNPITITAPPYPAAPSNLVGTATSPTQIDFTWRDNSTSESNFVVEISDDNVNFRRFVTLAADTTAWGINFFNAGTTYSFRLYATPYQTAPSYSNVVRVTTPTSGSNVPAAPTGLTATAVSPTQVDLAWTDNASNETGFEVERAPDGASFARVATTGANVRQFSDNGVSGSNAYTYRVRAMSASTGSAYSNTASVTTPAGSATGGPWNDVGINPSAPGGSSEFGSVVTVRGSGADIWDRSDAFQYREQSWSGNGELVAQVTSMTNTNSWAKAGLMFRESPAANSRHITIVVTPQQGVALQHRPVTGGDSQTLSGSNSAPPRWIKLVRNGSVFTGYESADGQSWNVVGSVTLDLPNQIFAGLAVTSHNTGATCSATFDHVALTATGTPPPPPPPPANTLAAPGNLRVPVYSANVVFLDWNDLSTDETGFELERSLNGSTFTPLAAPPANATEYADQTVSASTTYYYRIRAVRGTDSSAYSNTVTVTTTTPWTSSDIGAVGASGSTSGSGSNITLTGSGADIWDRADEFRYYYQSWSGLGEIIVRVTGLANTNGWAKAGVMFRESTAPNSRHVMLCVSAGNGVALQRRTSTGGDSVTSSGSSSSALPRWLKLTRNASTFVAYESTDGANWTQVGTVTLDLPNSLYVGLAVTSHNDGTLCTAQFDNLQVGGGSSPDTTAPLAPGSLSATAVSSSRINLSWSDNSNNETGFEIERSRDSTNFSRLALSPPNTTTFADTAVSSATTFYYRVRAANGNVLSNYSAIATATTPGDPPPASGWPGGDVGNVAAAGSHSGSGSSFTVNGSGADIWGTSDGFHYAYQAFNGDGVFIARVTSMTNTDGWAKAGIMLRENLTSNARHVMVCVNPGNAAGFFHRDTVGGATDFSLGVYEIQRMWIKLVRTGNTFQAFQSADGAVWYAIGSPVTVNMAGNLFAGLVVTSHHDGTLCTATFENVSFTGGAPSSGTTVAAPSGLSASAASASQVNLVWTDNSANETAFQIERSTDGTNFAPASEAAANATSFSDSGRAGSTTYYYRVRAMAGATSSGYSNVASVTTPAGSAPAATWLHADIGAVGVAGSDDASGNAFTVRGAGADIWGNADGFRFLYQAMNGDCEIETEVTSLTNTNGWAKAGVMIRESTAANAPNVFILLNPSNVLALQARATAGGSTGNPAGPWWLSPRTWVRLVRAGNTFTAYSSSDGSAWTVRGSVTMSMSASVLAGFAVTSHDTSVLATGTFTEPFIR